MKQPTFDINSRSYYSENIKSFCSTDREIIFAKLALRNEFDLIESQRSAWLEQILILQNALSSFDGSIYLEFDIPRMGKRADVIVVIGPVIFVIEFKVGKDHFLSEDLDQVVDYALDLQNFHEGSHNSYIAPIIVCTDAPSDKQDNLGSINLPTDKLFGVFKSGADRIGEVFHTIVQMVHAAPIPIKSWEESRYKPTPTIIEATLALYRGHSVAEITKNDAGLTNLSTTSASVENIIENSRRLNLKSICFVTGVPGAGKTLVGLNAATKHIDHKDELYSVFLSGNGPLVAILQEALARDKVRQGKIAGENIRKEKAKSAVKAFIQNIHHFRDDCLKNPNPPIEHVAIFDEAQRAWNKQQTVDFMKRKKGIADFDQSESEYLISCMDRHKDWAVIICLVGGGQEINTGEAGIKEWLISLNRSFPDWKVYLSDHLIEADYNVEAEVKMLSKEGRIHLDKELHLDSSIRSFRCDKVSRLVKEVLDLDLIAGQGTLKTVIEKYPIVLTRNLPKARAWLRKMAKGSERYGIVVSSQAERLKPHAVDVRSPVNPVHWFLGEKNDVRSSYYLEDVATEFHIQGLELDWTCVVWDADLRYSSEGWGHWSFRGSKWQRILSPERKAYLKNAYRVLLTRARQGMVLVVRPTR